MNPVNFLNPTEISGLGPRYVRHPGPFAITDADLDKMFPGIAAIQTEPYVEQHVKGDADPPNLVLLTRVIRYLQPARLLEVGTFRGKTTYNFAIHSPSDARVYTVDLPQDMLPNEVKPGYGTDFPYIQGREKIGVVFKDKLEAKKIEQIFADSNSLECERLLDELLQGGTIDFAFIDAAHDYRSVRDNFERLVQPRMTAGGVVAFDNYGDLQTHVGVSHFLQRAAHDQGIVFYWYAPLEKERKTTNVLFLNVPESTNYKWAGQ